MQEVLEWIRNHYNQDISLDDVAAQMGLSATYASKQIKAYTGMNVVNYINTLRIEHAKELLAGTKMSSNEIGDYVGFRYSQSFIRTFRKVVGMTPGNYRSLHQKGSIFPTSKTKTAKKRKSKTKDGGRSALFRYGRRERADRLFCDGFGISDFVMQSGKCSLGTVGRRSQILKLRLYIRWGALAK